MNKKLNDKSKSSLDNLVDEQSPGKRTKELLKKKKIVSPKMIQPIQIKEGLWLIPTKELTTKKEIDQFIKEKRKKFKLD